MFIYFIELISYARTHVRFLDSQTYTIFSKEKPKQKNKKISSYNASTATATVAGINGPINKRNENNEKLKSKYESNKPSHRIHSFDVNVSCVFSLSSLIERSAEMPYVSGVRLFFFSAVSLFCSHIIFAISVRRKTAQNRLQAWGTMEYIAPDKNGLITIET